MKTSINYLPEQKRDDLRRIVECVLEVLPDCEMIILYGSYARNTYVDYDQRIEYGIRTCFMSDYDILVVTSTRFQRYIINHILSKATDNYYKGKNRYASTTVQFIDESIDDLNKAIDKNRYFYTDIKREGIMLYNSGRYKLARRRKLNYREIKKSWRRSITTTGLNVRMIFYEMQCMTKTTRDIKYVLFICIKLVRIITTA